jgi:hypothetical protein
MKKFSAPAPTPRREPANPSPPAEFLEFPDGADFSPPWRRTEPAAALRFCEEMAPFYRYSDLDRAMRQNRPDAEFDLDHPATVPASYPADLIDELLRGCEGSSPV